MITPSGLGRGSKANLVKSRLPATTRFGHAQKALVALQHSILTSVWHMLFDNADYHDLGGDHLLRRDPDRERRRAIAALNKLGYTVTLNPIEPVPAAA